MWTPKQKPEPHERSGGFAKEFWSCLVVARCDVVGKGSHTLVVSVNCIVCRVRLRVWLKAFLNRAVHRIFGDMDIFIGTSSRRSENRSATCTSLIDSTTSTLRFITSAHTCEIKSDLRAIPPIPTTDFTGMSCSSNRSTMARDPNAVASTKAR